MSSFDRMFSQSYNPPSLGSDFFIGLDKQRASQPSDKAHYSYDTIGNGLGVTLTSPDGSDVFLQDDAASAFLEEIEQLDEVWEGGNPNPGIFTCYEDHLDLLIDPYFGG